MKKCSLLLTIAGLALSGLVNYPEGFADRPWHSFGVGLVRACSLG